MQKLIMLVRLALGSILILFVQSQPLTVTWRGNDITNKPTLIYHDDVETVNPVPSPPALVNPNSTGGLVCSSTGGPNIAWWPGYGRMQTFDTNVMRVIYQIIPSGNLTAQIVNDGREEYLYSHYHNGLFTCRRNGDITTAVPVGFYNSDLGDITLTGVSIMSLSYMNGSLIFTVVGDTEGGPPETYTWTRNGANITDGDPFSISIGVNGVTDPRAYEYSRYRSTLTVTGKLPGVYQYSVSNRATNNTLTANVSLHYMTVTWNGTDITGRPTLIYHDEVVSINYSSPPTIVNPNGLGGLICSSIDTVGPIAWHPGDGSTVIFDYNIRERIIYQIIPSGNLTAQIVRDGRSHDIPRTSYHNGLFTCRWNGDISTAVPVGFYQRGCGTVRIPEVSIMSSSFTSPSPSFLLAGDTEGGPPETYIWTRNGVPITHGGPFSISIGVNGLTDPKAYDNSRYRSTLAVNGRFPGVYQYSVSNRATPNTLTSNINIEGNAPTNLTVRQNGINSVLVSWTAPSPAPGMGYRITSDTTDFSSGSDTTSSATSHIIAIKPGAHRIRLKALSQHYPSEIVGPVDVIIRDFVMPIVMSSSLTAISVTIAWSQPEGSLSTADYIISLQRLTGSNRQMCPMIMDNRQSTTTATSFDFTNLREFTIYTVTVTARLFGVSRTSTHEFTTLSAAPTGVPQNITSSVAARSINVSWNEIECIERNGMISNYSVEFSPLGGSVIPGVVMMDERRYTVSGLTPFTNYTFQVAGVNSVSTGPLSDVVTMETLEDIPGPVSDLRSKLKFTSIDITWAHPQEPNGIILYYEITYTANNYDPVTNDTGLNATFTISGLTPGTRVSVSVSAYTSAGQGAQANLTDLVTLREPPIVTNVRVETVGDTSVQVSWEIINISDMTHYTVFYNAVMRQLNEQSVDVPSSQNSVVIDNLRRNVAYTFQVAVIVQKEDTILTGNRSLITPSSIRASPASETYRRDISIGVVVTFILTVILNNTILFAAFRSCKRSKGKSTAYDGDPNTYEITKSRLGADDQMEMDSCEIYEEIQSASTLPSTNCEGEYGCDNVNYGCA